MSSLTRPGLAHRLYEALGISTVIADHLENGTAALPGDMESRLGPLMSDTIQIFWPIVCDGYFALTNPKEEADYEDRLIASIGEQAFERLNLWANQFVAALTHITRVMRISDMPLSIEAPEIRSDSEQNRKQTLASLIEGDDICSGFPIDLAVQQSNACNLRCRHCYQSADQDFPILTFGVGLAKRLFESPVLGSISKIALAGRGEPTLSQASAVLLNAVSGNEKCEKSIFTNGTLPNAMKHIVPLLTAGYVSFDGASAETFEAVRAGADFEKVIRNLEALAPQDRARLTFNHVLTRLSISEAPDLVRLAGRLGMRAVNFVPLETHDFLPVLRRLQFAPSDRENFEACIAEARKVGKDLRVAVVGGDFTTIVTVDESETRPLDEVRAELGKVEPAAYRRPQTDPCKEIERLLNDGGATSLLQAVIAALPELAPEPCETGECKDAPTVLPECGWPWTTAYLEADGSIVPCCGPLTRTPMGNLRFQTFEEIWNGPAYRRLRRQQVGGDAPFQGCLECTRGIRFMHLQKACEEILTSPNRFQGRKFVNPIPVPPIIANLGAVKAVLDSKS